MSALCDAPEEAPGDPGFNPRKLRGRDPGLKEAQSGRALRVRDLKVTDGGDLCFR